MFFSALDLMNFIYFCTREVIFKFSEGQFNGQQTCGYASYFLIWLQYPLLTHYLNFGLRNYLVTLISEYFGVIPSKIFGVWFSSVYPSLLHFLSTVFRKLSKLGVLCPSIFSRNYPKFLKDFLEMFSISSKSIKTIIFVPKLVKHHYNAQTLGNFSVETQKTAN